MKNNKLTKVISIIIAVCAIAVMAVPSFAADITTNGGNGTTPVNLYSTDDGTLNGDPAPTALSVTIPTALPVAVGTDGETTTADNAKITNNSFGAVRVKTATISGANSWTLVPFGNKSTLASEKVDSNKIGFAMKLGNGAQVKTANTNNSQALISAPVTGCYMSGVGDTTKNSVAVAYDAIVTPVSTAVTNKTVANIVFVVEFDTAA